MSQLFNLFRSNNIISRKLYSQCKISNLDTKELGQKINIKGWIKGIRNMKENFFIDINDGTTTRNIQAILNKNSKKDFGYGASIEVNGILSLSPKGNYELKVDDIQTIGECPLTDGFPFTPRQTYPPEYIRNHLEFRSRVSSFTAMLRIRHNATTEFCNYLNTNQFTQIHTPVLTDNDCEGAGEVFTVKPDNMKTLKEMLRTGIPIDEAFFDKKIYLTVSGQLHLETIAHGMGDVYSFGPTFRAENSKSPFHLSEFYMLEAEKCFIDSITEITNLLENMTKVVTKNLLEKSADDIFNLRKNNKVKKNENEEFLWLEKKFPVITYAESISILNNNKSKIKSAINEMDGLNKEQELFLVDYHKTPLFIIDWPKVIKPFYMRTNKTNSNLVDGVDFLFPNIGELAGGSIREDEYNCLIEKIPKGLEWYLNLRKFGGITTGGFGLGFERYLQYLLNITNIRDVIAFPRWAHNCFM